MFEPKTKGLIILSILVVLFIILVLLPADFFDEGQSICVSMILLNQECYGCGMTRGIMHLLHGNFQTAYEFNKLSFIVLPLFVLMILWELDRRFFNILFGKKPKSNFPDAQ
jgi:hypothetical protein